MGRPRLELNWDEIQKLCAIQATQEEIANWCKCSVDTLVRASQREHGVTFAEFYKKHADTGKISLRRAQFQAALKGNTALLIWLGKQMLGQREPKQEVEHTASPNAANPVLDLKEIREQLKAMKTVAEVPVLTLVGKDS